MNTILDLVGSFIIGGLLLLTLLRAQSNLVQRSYERTMDLIVQGNMATLVEVLQHDVRKMGFGVPDSVDAVSAADSTSLTFLADLDADGSSETVSYSVSDTSAASGTENPRDRLFFHRENGLPVEGIAIGVTDFHLTYLDASGSAATTPAQIRAVEIKITLESLYPYGDRYASIAWEGMIRPRSLNLY